MKTRLIAGIIAAVLVLILLFYGSFAMMLSCVLFCSVLAYLEFDRMFFEKRQISRQICQSVLILLTIAAIHHDITVAFFTMFGTFAVFAIYYVYVSSEQVDFKKIVKNISLHILGYLYLVSLFGFLVPIAEWPGEGRNYLLLLFLWVFVGDSTAYFVGMRFGKKKLSPGISPKKTVEGAVAAGISSIIVGIVWLRYICQSDWDQQYAFRILLFSPLVSILSQMGDLFESVLKRSRQQKDSGSFLPGHGGILDRVDGLVFAAPAFYVFLQFLLERTS